MFRGATPETVRLPYEEFVKPGVRLLRETITAIDPEPKRVTTDAGTHEADALVVALGADYVPGRDAWGWASRKSSDGSTRSTAPCACATPSATSRRAGSSSASAARPFQCPPASTSRVADATKVSVSAESARAFEDRALVLPFGRPVPPSPETSAALITAFEERDIRLISSSKVSALDLERRVVVLDDGGELPYELFLGVPNTGCRHGRRAKRQTEDGYVPVDSATLATRIPGVYAIGDVATQGTPKAGVFAEGAARALATSLVSHLRGSGPEGVHAGTGSCYIEFGAGRIGRVDIDFLSPGRHRQRRPLSRAEIGRTRRADKQWSSARPARAVVPDRTA